jgi:phosphatidylglycerophosphatase A
MEDLIMNENKMFEDAMKCEDMMRDFFQELLGDCEKKKPSGTEETMESLRDDLVFLASLVNIQGLLIQFYHGLNCMDEKDMLQMSEVICTMSEKVLDKWSAYKMPTV